MKDLAATKDVTEALAIVESALALVRASSDHAELHSLIAEALTADIAWTDNEAYVAGASALLRDAFVASRSLEAKGKAVEGLMDAAYQVGWDGREVSGTAPMRAAAAIALESGSRAVVQTALELLSRQAALPNTRHGADARRLAHELSASVPGLDVPAPKAGQPRVVRSTADRWAAVEIGLFTALGMLVAGVAALLVAAPGPAASGYALIVSAGCLAAGLRYGVRAIRNRKVDWKVVGGTRPRRCPN